MCSASDNMVRADLENAVEFNCETTSAKATFVEQGMASCFYRLKPASADQASNIWN